MNVAVKITGVPAAQQMLSGTARQIRIAQSRAIRGTLSWVRVRVRREAAKDLRLAQKHLQKRLIISRVKNGDTTGKLWTGTWNISPLVQGRVSTSIKTRVLQVGRYRYPGAFFARVYPQTRHDIWIRKKSKHFNPSLYPGYARVQRSVPHELRHRFPVVRAAIDIFPTMKQVFDRDEGEIRREFDKRLRREINYAMNIESGRFQHSGVGGSFSFPER